MLMDSTTPMASPCCEKAGWTRNPRNSRRGDLGRFVADAKSENLACPSLDWGHVQRLHWIGDSTRRKLNLPAASNALTIPDKALLGLVASRQQHELVFQASRYNVHWARSQSITIFRVAWHALLDKCPTQGAPLWLGLRQGVLHIWVLLLVVLIVTKYGIHVLNVVTVIIAGTKLLHVVVP